MAAASFDSEIITANLKRKFTNLTTIVISNYGTEALYVTAKGIKRAVPPVINSLGAPVPVAAFRIESYGHGFDVEIQVEFTDGTGNAIIDTVQIKEC